MIRAAVAVVVLAVVSACGNDGPDADIERARRAVVAIESQRCETPNRARGQGVIVGPDLVVTAGHVVEGDLRSLTIGGWAGAVVAIDRNADLALLTAELPDVEPPGFSALRPTELVLLGPDGSVPVHVAGHETLVIDHATDRATYRRDVFSFTPGVVEGMSGSPVVDEYGRLAGIVILNDQATGEGIAVASSAISVLLESAADSEFPEPVGTC